MWPSVSDRQPVITLMRPPSTGSRAAPAAEALLLREDAGDEV